MARGRVNAIGAVSGFEFVCVGLFGANIDSDIFYGWLTRELLPRIPEGAVVVMDNAAFHKRPDIRNAIEGRGGILEYLPPYSPDLNPIEHKWAQVKSIRRKYRCEDIDGLFLKHIGYATL